MKTCTKCGEEKPLDAFGKDKRNTDGRCSQCKTCRAAYREQNRGQLAEYAQRYYANNRDRVMEQRSVNAEQTRKQRREYYQANAEHRRKLNREYYQANAERLREQKREYHQANPDILAEHRSRRRARKRNAPHEPYSRSDIFAAYGGTCAYCDAPAEHLDHVRPISKGGADAAHNLLPACAPCNLGKGAKTLAQWAATFGPA